MRLAFGVGITDVGYTGGISDGADGGLLSSTFLSTYGPYGMVMDFTDASISINDETDVLDYSSQGTVSATTGALLGPRSKLSYSAPSAKLTEQADGYLGFQAHNLYLNSAAPANQSITVISGATYAITITGSVSVTASGAATGTWTAGTNTFTAATGTLTLGSTSGSGTVHVRRTPSVSTYVATTGAVVYDLPYVYSGGEKMGILPEPAATNLCLRSNEFDNVTNWSDAAGTLAFGSGSVANAVTSVFGTVTADKVVPNTSSSLHVLRQVISYTSGTTYTQSLIVSSAGYNYVQLVFPAPLFSATAQANFDLATGVLGTVGAGVTASIVDMGGGIYRVIATCTATGSGGLAAGPCFISSATSARTETWAPNGTDGLYFHHYQMETGTVATSPIITYGAAVTRAVDNLLVYEAAFPSLLTVGTLFIEAQRSVSDVMGYHLRYGTTATNYLMILDNGLNLSCDVREATAGVTAQLNVAGANALNTPYKIAMAATANDAAAVYNGGTVQTDGTVTMPTATTALYIGGQGPTANVSLNGLVRKVLAVPRRLSNAELQAITT